MELIKDFFYKISIIKFFLLIFILSIPFKNVVYQSSIVMIILYFVYFVAKNKDLTQVIFIILRYKNLIYILISILLTMIISNLINNMGLDSWRLILNYIYRYGLIFFIIIYFYSKELITKKTLLIYILISLSIQSFDGIYQSFYGYDIFKHNLGNIYNGLTGVTANRNTFAFLIGIGALILFLYNKNKNKYLYLILVFFMFNVLFSYSRAVWVSLFASLIIFLFLSFKNLNNKSLLSIIMFVFVLFMIVINVDSLNIRFNQLLSGYSSQRTDIWLSALPFNKENLFFGHGIDSTKFYDIYRGHYSLHNQTLEILFDTGLIGLFFFIVLLISILKEIFKYKDKNMFLILIYLLINGMFGESIINSKIMLSTLTIFMFFVFVNKLNLKKDNR